MKKLILAIFAVMCMQLAFVYFTALQSHMDLAVATPPVIPSPPIRPAAVNNNVATPIEPEIAEQAAPSAVRSSTRRTKLDESSESKTATPVHERRVHVKLRHTDPRPARQDDFQSVVISYKGEAGRTNCDPEVIEKPKKRSYLAKASPVVKAPWRFLKAVGSKLN
jgi:hypothetical protein